MPLIDLKTDLKSLRFGKDRIGGGSSNQPYITRNIPEGFSSLGALDNDFILRGGITAISDSGKDVLRLGKMFTDLRSPNGLFFVAKQNLLSRTAISTQTSGKLVNEGVYTPLSTLTQAGVNAFGIHVNKQGLNPFKETGAYANENNLYFNRIKLLNRTPTNEFSIVNEEALPSLPLILGSEGLSNANISIPTVKTNEKYSFTNRLVGFYDTQIITKTDNPNLYSYNGGPGSVLGVGQTNIRFADQRTGENNPNYEGNSKPNQTTEKYIGFTNGSNLISETFGSPISPFVLNNKLFENVVPVTQQKTWASIPDQTTDKYNWYKIGGATKEYILSTGTFKQFDLNSYWNLETGQPLWNNSVYNSGSTFPDGTNSANFDNGTITYNQEQLIEAQSYTDSGVIVDFRKIIRESLQDTNKTNNINSGQLTNSPEYSGPGAANIEKRVKLGDPGNRKNKSYASYSKGPIDKATGNPTGPLDTINASLPTKTGDTEEFRDLVTFNISTFDGWFMHFRAFLGAISDNFSSDVVGTQYVGRGEKFYTYGGFDRKISLSWTVAAQSKAELIPMYKKLSYLSSNLAPIYKNGFMQGPLVKLTVGGYFHQMPGYITGLTFELGEESPWEIGIDDVGNIDPTTTELTHIIKVSGFNFTPIPNYLPQKGAKFIDLYSETAPGNTLWNSNDNYAL